MTPWPGYVCKGEALQEAFAEAGIRFAVLDSVPTVSDLPRAMAIYDGVDPLPYERQRKKAIIRARAAELTEQRVPVRKVFKALSQAMTILAKAPAARSGAENTRLAAIIAGFANAGNVETAADALEADIDAMQDWRAVRDFSVETSPRWAD